MPPSKIAEGTANKGEYTYCWTTTAPNQFYVGIVNEAPVGKPLPTFLWLDAFEDVFNTSETVVTKILNGGNRACGLFTDNSPLDIYLYHELRSPLGSPVHWELWLYS